MGRRETQPLAAIPIWICEIQDTGEYYLLEMVLSKGGWVYVIVHITQPLAEETGNKLARGLIEA